MDFTQDILDMSHQCPLLKDIAHGAQDIDEDETITLLFSSFSHFIKEGEGGNVQVEFFP